MRIAVAVLNVLSSLSSLGMFCYGACLVSIGLLALKSHDYTPVTLGVMLVAAFSISPAASVVASTRLARQGRRSAILLALIPVALIVLTIMAFGVAFAILDPDD